MPTLLYPLLIALMLTLLFTSFGNAGDSDSPAPHIISHGGKPEEIGDTTGRENPRPIRSLMRVMSLRSIPARLFHRQRVTSLIAGISADHRAEIAALARAAEVDESDMLAANVLVDSQCSAMASPATEHQPLRVARNMDFFPATTLGKRTVLSIVRPDGKHAFASIGWPGFAGVVSGMNDAGLTVCILVNHDNHYVPGGQPICFRLRELLEGSSTVEEAVSRFSATPVASSHYVLLADVTTATVVWQDSNGTVHRHLPQDGWLACSNGRRSADGLPLDWRGKKLQELASTFDGETVTEVDMRQALTATYLSFINAQAMVFVPATATVDLAIGGMWHPAARGSWHSFALKPLFAGQRPADAKITALAAVEPLRHPLLLR